MLYLLLCALLLGRIDTCSRPHVGHLLYNNTIKFSFHNNTINNVFTWRELYDAKQPNNRISMINDLFTVWMIQRKRYPKWCAWNQSTQQSNRPTTQLRDKHAVAIQTRITHGICQCNQRMEFNWDRAASESHQPGQHGERPLSQRHVCCPSLPSRLFSIHNNNNLNHLCYDHCNNTHIRLVPLYSRHAPK